jgi:hypothetical protein
MPKSPIVPQNNILFLVGVGIYVFRTEYWPHDPNILVSEKQEIVVSSHTYA